MGYTKGSVNFGSTLNVTAQGALDSRLVVNTTDDLLNGYTADGNYYEGMVVTVLADKTQYMLINPKEIDSLENGWKKLPSEVVDTVTFVEKKNNTDNQMWSINDANFIDNFKEGDFTVKDGKVGLGSSVSNGSGKVVDFGEGLKITTTADKDTVSVNKSSILGAIEFNNKALAVNDNDGKAKFEAITSVEIPDGSGGRIITTAASNGAKKVSIFINGANIWVDDEVPNKISVKSKLENLEAAIANISNVTYTSGAGISISGEGSTKTISIAEDGVTSTELANGAVKTANLDGDLVIDCGTY